MAKQPNEASAAASAPRTWLRRRPPLKIAWVSPANSPPVIVSPSPRSRAALVSRLPLIASAG